METAPKRAALYARVSTNDGSQSPAMQLRELHEYCGRQGWQIAGEYVDHMSGARKHRPELDKLMADCHRRKVDVVVVFRYNRFARSLHQLVTALADFQELGIGFISLHENCDTSTSQGRLVFNIIASLAEFERELIAENVVAGIANARANGVRFGRPKWKPQCTVEAAQKLRKQGKTLREIAADLDCTNVWVYKLLRKGTQEKQTL